MKVRAVASVLFCLALACAVRAGTVISFDTDWRFSTGDPAGAQAPQFNDAAWSVVETPHDWSIAGPIAQNNPMGRAGGFFPAGVGWYRKSFTLPAMAAGTRISVCFDGVYMLSEVWINGKSMGVHPYGYTPFSYDITEAVKLGGPNVIAVRVDNSRQVNSRWYSGSGIFRHVHLELRDPLHVVPDTVQVQTLPVAQDDARLKLLLNAENAGANDAPVSARIEIYALDAAGQRAANPVAKVGPTAVNFQTRDGRKTAGVEADVHVRDPQLWSPEHPARYVAVTTLTQASRDLDSVETPFGIRTIEASAAKGFLLNGQRILLAGACVHHDLGPLGGASFDRAEERRVEILKAAGFNAIRTSHNPPSTAFLDACDRLGMLVMDEAFDTWEQQKTAQDYHLYFNDWWQRDIDAFVLRDRNHPSVIMWSIGNEISDLGAARGLRDGAKLVERIKQLDTTRPVTDAVQLYSGMAPRDFPWTWNDADPLLAKLDIVGYNYQMGKYNADHQRVPERVIVAAESYPRDMFTSWQWAADHTWVVGDFIWTGWDYLGESGIGRIQAGGGRGGGGGGGSLVHGASCGDIDLTGFRKSQSHARNITWDRGEKMFTSIIEQGADGRPLRGDNWSTTPSRESWTWPGLEGKPVDVQVYSRYDAVRVSLNGTVIAEKPTGRGEQFKAVISVPYAPGTLTTEGLVGGKVVATSRLKTVGPVSKLRLTADRNVLHADGQDLSFITVESLDADGNFQPNGDQEVTFEVNGPGTLAGVANGDLGTADNYQAKSRKLYQGRALLIVRAAHQPGTVDVRATAGGLAAAAARIDIR
jgi:beta-galactosidase